MSKLFLKHVPELMALSVPLVDELRHLIDTLNSGSGTTSVSGGAAGQILISAGVSSATWTTPAALTRTNDTNVTVTLGGSATTALVNAASLTLGWAGTLATTRGGLGANVTPAGAGELLCSSSASAYGHITAGTLGYWLKAVGAGAVPQWTAAGALVGTNDTNVTVALGGTPNYALLAYTTLTLGWTGTLAATRGGTGTGSFAVGDLLYASTTTALAKLADVAVGQVLCSGGVSTAPAWSGSPTLIGLVTISPAAGANQALQITQSGLNGTGAASPFFYNRLYLPDDNYAGGAVKVNQLLLHHVFGGAAMTGGRNTLEVVSDFSAASHADNTDRNYVAAAFSIYASDDDGGGAGTEKGGFFCVTGNAIAEAGATNLVDLTWCELNVAAQTGSSMLHKASISIAAYPSDVVQGSVSDTAISISRQAGSTLSTAIGWNHGILFSNKNGDYPMATDGTLFGVSGAATIATGIDLQGWTISGHAFASNSGDVSLTASNQGVELGSSAGANAPFIDFHSSGNANDYDARLTASAGAAGAGLGNLSVYGSFQVGGAAVRAGTAGTNRVDIFDGTAPTSTLANGCSIYSTSGELFTMDAGGTATQQTPHDDEGFWHFFSRDTVKGRVLQIDVERLLRYLNSKFDLDYVHEWTERVTTP